LSDNIVRFPSVVVASATEFRRFRKDNSELLDERYRRELALGSKDRHITRQGTCALCLLATRFMSATGGGTTTDDGFLVPNWREQQVCGCHYGLKSRQRALLHLALSRFGATGWVRAALLGHEVRIAKYLATLTHDIAVWQNLAEQSDAPALPADTASVHLVVSAEYLHHLPFLDAALRGVARVLAPGGCFVFTVPFYIDLEATHTYALQPLVGKDGLRAVPSQPAHQVGWDIIDRLTEAGFTDSTAHCYWSEEFGYLGTFNIIFLAYR
jgi:SAM-dependent methyltransferase